MNLSLTIKSHHSCGAPPRRRCEIETWPVCLVVRAPPALSAAAGRVVARGCGKNRVFHSFWPCFRTVSRLGCIFVINAASWPFCASRRGSITAVPFRRRDSSKHRAWAAEHLSKRRQTQAAPRRPPPPPKKRQWPPSTTSTSCCRKTSPSVGRLPAASRPREKAASACPANDLCNHSFKHASHAPARPTPFPMAAAPSCG